MTRPRAPRTGEDGVEPIDLGQLVAKVPVWLDRLGEIGGQIDRDVVAAELRHIAMSMLGGHSQGTEAFTIREAKDGLLGFLKRPGTDAALRLNSRAEAALLDVLWLIPPPPELAHGQSATEAYLEGHLTTETLCAAAEDALIRIDTPRLTKAGAPAKGHGRPRSDTLEWAVGCLCELWERSTGTTVTSWNSSHNEYSSTSTSPAGIWITEVITALSGDHLGSAVRRHVDAFVKSRKVAA